MALFDFDVTTCKTTQKWQKRVILPHQFRLTHKKPVEMDADAWIESNGINEIVEHSIGSPRHGFVLSILWIRPN